MNTYISSVLYSIGIVELSLESTSALVFLVFVVPLAFTLSGFLLWIMYSLSGVCFDEQIFRVPFNNVTSNNQIPS